MHLVVVRLITKRVWVRPIVGEVADEVEWAQGVKHDGLCLNRFGAHFVAVVRS